MALNNGEVLYGLRNLATGDDEESRIQDVVSEVSPQVHELIERGHYHLAYRVAIRESGIKVELHECEDWARWWLDETDEDAEKLAAEMYEQYLLIMKPDGQAISHHLIDGIEYMFIIDEGFSPAWVEQISDIWGEYNGPFYVYKTSDEVLTLVSKAPMDADQRYAAEHPENSKM